MSPLANALLEQVFWVCFAHASDPVCPFQQIKQGVHNAGDTVEVVRLGVDSKGDLFAQLAHGRFAFLPVRILHERPPDLPADLFGIVYFFIEKVYNC